jgi:hypothetical protein
MAARLGCYVTAQLSPYQGEKLFEEFGRLQPSKSALTRLSTQLGETWESEQTQLERLFCADITIPENAVTVSASLAIHSPKSGEKCKKEALFGVI